MEEILTCPNTFDGVEDSRFDLSAGDTGSGLHLDYWYHDDLRKQDFAYQVVFERYRYFRFEKMIFQDVEFENQVSKFDVIYSSRSPSIFAGLCDSEQARETNKSLTYFKTLIYGVGYIEISAINVVLMPKSIHDFSWIIKYE